MKSILINNIFFIKFNKKKIIPVIIQELFTKKILMLAWINYKNIFNILYFKNTFYITRNNFSLWIKGYYSLNFQYIKKILLDCDMDIIILVILQNNNISCHTKNFSCFKELY